MGKVLHFGKKDIESEIVKKDFETQEQINERNKIRMEKERLEKNKLVMRQYGMAAKKKG